MFRGLAPAVAVCAWLPKLARLVTLAGLVLFSSTEAVAGMVIAFAALLKPSLIDVVATGASCGLLIAAPPPAIKDDRALLAGLSLIAEDVLLSLSLAISSLLRRWSSNAAAPVSGAGEKVGENAPLNLGDLGIADCPKRVLEGDVVFGFCD
jgi:hypothetical protein